MAADVAKFSAAIDKVWKTFSTQEVLDRRELKELAERDIVQYVDQRFLSGCCVAGVSDAHWWVVGFFCVCVTIVVEGTGHAAHTCVMFVVLSVSGLDSRRSDLLPFSPGGRGVNFLWQSLQQLMWWAKDAHSSQSEKQNTISPKMRTSQKLSKVRKKRRDRCPWLISKPEKQTSTPLLTRGNPARVPFFFAQEVPGTLKPYMWRDLTVHTTCSLNQALACRVVHGSFDPRAS